MLSLFQFQDPTTLSDTALHSMRQTYFELLLWSSGAVLIGVLLEGPELFFELRKTVAKYASTVEHELPDWLRFVGLLGWLLVFVGVGGEMVFEAFVASFDKVAEARTSKTIDDARSAAQKATGQAQAVLSEASALKTQLDLSEGRINDVAKAMVPRQFTEEDEAWLTLRFAACRAEEAAVTIRTPRSGNVAEVIRSALFQAGHGNLIVDSEVRGIDRLFIEGPPQFEQPMYCFARALNHSGIVPKAAVSVQNGLARVEISIPPQFTGPLPKWAQPSAYQPRQPDVAPYEIDDPPSEQRVDQCYREYRTKRSRPPLEWVENCLSRKD